MAAGKVRYHFTARDPKDKWSSVLPEDIKNLIGEKIGQEYLGRLLTSDFSDEVEHILARFDAQ